MKAAFLFLALVTASCGSPGQALVGEKNIVAAEKALTLAHLAYDGVGLSLKSAAETGVLRGASALTAKCWYDRAGDLLIAADKADVALNAPGIMSAITAAQDAIVQAKTPTAACA